MSEPEEGGLVVGSTSLRDLREAIDDVDAVLVRVLAARLRASTNAARLKRRFDLPVHDPEREAEIVARAPEGPIRDIYREIVAACRRAADEATR